jgi:hypothetical protein
MASVREHLKKAHEAIASHHRTMSQAHSAAMEKETMGTHHHSFHKAAAAAHTAAAEAHDEMCNECAKAADGDLNKLVPTSVSAVVPTRITAVPRTGQPVPATVKVDPEFQKMFQVEDEREAS